MFIEIVGVCQSCATEVKALLWNDQLIEVCTKCGHTPFELRPIPGLIYIIKNPNQKGVKIGLTTKSMEQRLKSLNSTGVPGGFEPFAMFPSELPKADEKRVHEKLKKYNFSKEHFDLEPIDAVLGAYRALNRRKPIFFDSNSEETFNLKLDEARIKMQLKLRGQGG